METFELRYFLAAAEFESVHKAAQQLAISPPAISKAIKRLEDQLGVQLFDRVGRNIVLSVYGKQFQMDASRIIGNIDDMKSKFKPTDHHVGISLIGTEFGLSAFVAGIAEKLDSKKIQYSLNLKTADSSKDVGRAVVDGEAHLGIVSRSPSTGFKKLKLGDYQSKIYVGPDHPLYKKDKVQIEELLKFDFASFLGTVFCEADLMNQSIDGWRDDKFKRKISFKSDSIESVLRVIEAGRYIGYLPTPLADGRGLFPLKVMGCPYQCLTEVYLIANKSTDYSWMRAIL